MTVNKKQFVKFLFSSLASAAIVSIYSIVDAICIGQYSGSVGSAAIAACIPVWSVVYALGILFGMGGATLMTAAKAQGIDKEKEGNSYFTLAFILTAVTAVIVWVAFILCRDNLLVFFGAKNDAVLNCARDYSYYFTFVLPFFVFVNFLNAFVRNDNNPVLASIAAISGGLFNIFGDVFFVFDFGLGMGTKGAGLATAIGQVITVLILLAHFLKKNNGLKFTKISDFSIKCVKILKTGISAFVLDVCIGVVIILFNNQINRYTNNNATILGVYGIICNMLTLAQGFSYAVGQANQPLLSKAFGAKDTKSVKELNKYGMFSSLIIGCIFLLIFMLGAPLLIKVFINTDINPDALTEGPNLIRMYFACVPLLSLNVYTSYYYQTMQKTGKSFIISFLRGVILPIALIYLLPLVKFELIFLELPMVDALVIIINIIFYVVTRKKRKAQVKIQDGIKIE